MRSEELTTNHGVFPDFVSQLGRESEQAGGSGGGGVGGGSHGRNYEFFLL